MRWIRVAVAVVVAALGSGVGSAAAQDATIAEQLYRDGQKLIAAGKTHEACLKFSDSERADHALGTLVALAACHEREGKVASAWTEFGEATALAERNRDATRARYARTHAAALAPRVRRVRIEVTPPVAGTTLELEGKTYGEGTLGSAIPLDPGEYAIQVRAPGKKPFSRTLTVGATGGEERVAVTLEDLPRPAAASDVPAAVTPTPAPAPLVPAREPAPSSSGARTAGLVVGGVGVALGVVAVVLEANASSLSRKAQDDARAANASGSDAAYQSAAFTHDDAVSTQRLALVAGGVAVVALGVGVYLVLSAPSRDGGTRAVARVVPVAFAGGGGLAVGGGF